MARKSKRPDTVKLVIRLPRGLWWQLTGMAGRKNQSLNSEMVEALKDWAKRNPAPGRSPIELSVDEKLDKLIALVEKEEKDEPK